MKHTIVLIAFALNCIYIIWKIAEEIFLLKKEIPEGVICTHLKKETCDSFIWSKLSFGKKRFCPRGKCIGFEIGEGNRIFNCKNIWKACFDQMPAIATMILLLLNLVE